MTYNDIVNYYLSVPPINISPNNLPTYSSLVQHIAEVTLLEYSKLKPILKEKTLTTNNNQNFIDVYVDIDANYLDLIIFDKTSNLTNGLFIENFNLFLQPMMQQNNMSFLLVQSFYDNLYYIKKYFKPKVEHLLFNGKLLKCESNTEYYILYEAIRMPDEIYNEDIDRINDLFKINILSGLLESNLFTGEQPIQSVSISGISVSFNIERKESLRQFLDKAKRELISSICNIHQYVERW